MKTLVNGGAGLIPFLYLNHHECAVAGTGKMDEVIS